MASSVTTSVALTSQLQNLPQLAKRCTNLKKLRVASTKFSRVSYGAKGTEELRTSFLRCSLGPAGAGVSREMCVELEKEINVGGVARMLRQFSTEECLEQVCLKNRKQRCSQIAHNDFSRLDLGAERGFQGIGDAASKNGFLQVVNDNVQLGLIRDHHESALEFMAIKSREGNDQEEFGRSIEHLVQVNGVNVNKTLLKSQSKVTKSSSPIGLFLGGALLALGFGVLSCCKPAFAENIVPPTLTATLNDKGEVELQELKKSETESAELKDENLVSNGAMDAEMTPGSSDIGAEDFEPRFGQGSDLTNDPAEVLLRSYLDRYPTDKKALQALLFLRLRKGEVDASLPVLKTLIELEPENLEWKYVRAQANEYAGDLPKARQGFEEILESKPLSVRAFQGLAVVMHKMGDEEEAQQMLVDAVKQAVDAGQSKEAINLRMLLGQLHTMQGNLEKAMEVYQTVVQEDPKDYRPYLCQGLVYSIIGEEAEAEKQFRRYRKLCPKDFPHRGFLDDLMLKAKSESQLLKKRIKDEAELKAKGQKLPKPMRQPLASGASPLKESDVAS